MPHLYDRSIQTEAIGWDQNTLTNHLSSAYNSNGEANMLSFSLPSQCFLWHLFMQCIAGSLLDPMKSFFFWLLSWSKMNPAPLPRGIPALCHRMRAGWPRPWHQATCKNWVTVRGAAMSCWWFGLTAWGVDGNRYHTDPCVFHNCANLGASFSGKICQVFWSFEQRTLSFGFLLFLHGPNLGCSVMYEPIANTT